MSRMTLLCCAIEALHICAPEKRARPSRIGLKRVRTGDTFSENELGRVLYDKGIPGVLDKNSKSGIEWFAKAAAGGDAAAQKNLAIANAMQPPGP